MPKIKVKTIKSKIHQVPFTNLISINEGRRKWARKNFNKLIKTSKHMIIMSIDVDGNKDAYTTLGNEELFYYLEKFKQSIS